MKLTVFERLKLLGWLGAKQGTYKEIKIAVSILEKLDLSEEEVKEVGLERKQGQFEWKEDGREFEIDFSHSELDMLAGALKDQWSYSVRIGRMLEKIEQALS